MKRTATSPKRTVDAIGIDTIRTGRTARINPVAKLLTGAIIGIPLIVSLDVVSAGTALGIELVLFFFAGLTWRQFWMRTWPAWLAAPLTGVTIALYGQASGDTYFQWAFINVTEGSLQLAAATVLRVLAIALPSIVLFVTVDPTDLADGLAQILKLPARFVLGGLAGLRMIGLFIDDWRAMELARRARGVADRGRIRRFLGMAFGLLVLSIRRGSKLATAMEARGFGGKTKRTWARESTFGTPEWVLIAIAVAIPLVAITTSVIVGAWNPILAPD